MILVTGATGLLGSRLLFDLLSNGNQVRALRRESSRSNCLDHYFKSAPQLLEKVEWVTGDITDVFAVEEALRDVTHVYHCAGRVSFQPNDRERMHHINVQGTANIVN